jgi:DNA-binding transcriptional ArsR family regulator
MLTIKNTKRPDLGVVFAALADPTRRAIVSRLATSDATVLELAAPFDMSLPAISRHLKVLERAALITRGRDGRHRPCRLQPEVLTEVAQWASFTQKAWDERFDRLNEFLKSNNHTKNTEKENRNEK